MQPVIKITRAQLKILAAVFSNFVVVWLIAMLGTKDSFGLTANFFLAILSWKLAVKTEELSGEKDD